MSLSSGLSFLGLAPARASRLGLLLSFVLALSPVAMRAEAPETFAEAGREAHAMLTRLCDDFGGRPTGSAANRAALDRLAEELRSLGLKPEFAPFSMPGWERGDDRVELLAPFRRSLRVASLSYAQSHEAFEADVVDIGKGGAGDYSAQSRGCVGLLDFSTPLSLREILAVAKSRGLRGLLTVNRESGGQLLARTGSFVGEPLPFPVYSMTQEEGRWLQRLLARGRSVRVSMLTRSRCVPAETANLVLRFPGRSSERIVVGAHFDSWDLGQGALDNGLGTAQLYALALALRGRELARTVELVWFNGEELGLWGSRKAAAMLGDAPVVAMVNLDMVGVPVAVNANGDASLLPSLERWLKTMDGRLPQGVKNTNWFGSDHSSYQLAGVRVVTLDGPIPRDSVRYYHDFADTIDKLPEATVADSSAVIGALVLFLSSDDTLAPFRRPALETEKIFKDFDLDRRMRAIGFWPFDARTDSSR